MIERWDATHYTVLAVAVAGLLAGLVLLVRCLRAPKVADIPEPEAKRSTLGERQRYFSFEGRPRMESLTQGDGPQSPLLESVAHSPPKPISRLANLSEVLALLHDAGSELAKEDALVRSLHPDCRFPCVGAISILQQFPSMDARLRVVRHIYPHISDPARFDAVVLSQSLDAESAIQAKNFLRLP